MDNIGYAKNLYENGLISKEEYDTILQRVNANEACKNKKDGTVIKFIENFKEYLMKHGSAEGTANVYCGVAKKFFVSMYKDDKKFVYSMELKDFSVQDINKFLAKESTGKSLTYIRNINKALVKMALYINESQTFKIDISQMYNTCVVAEVMMNGDDINYMSPEEVYEIADKLGGRAAAIIILSYECCLKRDEIMNIKVNDIKESMGLVLIKNKTGEIDRVVVGSAKLFKYVNEHLRLLERELEISNDKRLSRNEQPIMRNDLVFQSLSAGKGNVSPSYFKGVLKRAIENSYSEYTEAEVEKTLKCLTFESLKKSRILYYYLNNCNQEVIDRTAGKMNKALISKYKKEAEMIRGRMK